METSAPHSVTTSSSCDAVSSAKEEGTSTTAAASPVESTETCSVIVDVKSTETTSVEGKSTEHDVTPAAVGPPATTTTVASTTSETGATVLSKRQQKKKLRAQKYREMRQKGKPVRDHQSAEKEEKGFNFGDWAESDYYIENGLRKVYPYHYTFSTYAKGRWLKSKLRDILSGEFGFDDDKELSSAFAEGRIQVNNMRATEDHVLKDCDYISHRIHRHENAVTAEPIEVIADTDSVLVVNKPSSMPVHPCGRYRFNSLAFILGKVYGYTNLRNIHRLDRLTSGILLMGKTPEKTKQLEDQLLHRQVQKEYVCRVVGEFPIEEVTVDQPLAPIFNKMRLQIVTPKGKASLTRFKRISYNGTSSVVRCYPATGRTHQIRVHLQYLGHPIINDNFYNSEAWGPSRGKGAVYDGGTFDEICERIGAEHVATMWEAGENPEYIARFGSTDMSTNGVENGTITATKISDSGDTADEQSKNNSVSINNCKSSTPAVSDSMTTNNGNIPELSEPTAKRVKLSPDIVDVPEPTDVTELCDPNKSVQHSPSSASVEPCRVKYLRDQPVFDKSKMSLQEGCDYCRKIYSDPTKRQLVMFLHALKYSGPGWEYETTMPDWALPDWNKEEEFTL